MLVMRLRCIALVNSSALVMNKDLDVAISYTYVERDRQALIISLKVAEETAHVPDIQGSICRLELPNEHLR